MDNWMAGRSDFADDMRELFAALGDLTYRYDWLITETWLYFQPQTPPEVRERWQWTGLLMDGEELTRHLREGNVYVISGAFSAVPKGCTEEDLHSAIPTWEVDYSKPDYAFQSPLTQLELFCYDGYAFLINCDPSQSPEILQKLPMLLTPEEYYRATTPRST